MNTQNIREFVDCAEMDFNGAGAREPEPDTAVIPIVLQQIKTQQVSFLANIGLMEVIRKVFQKILKRLNCI